MRSITALAVVWLALNASAAADTPAAACRPQTIKKTVPLTFPDGKTIRVSVADTPEQREKGLMCVTRYGRNSGMLFVFPQSRNLNFWMKNTLVSLDMVWINSYKMITGIREKMPASRLDTPDDRVAAAGGYGSYVLELPAGAAARHNLKKGDVLSFDAEIPND